MKTTQTYNVFDLFDFLDDQGIEPEHMEDAIRKIFPFIKFWHYHWRLGVEDGKLVHLKIRIRNEDLEG